MANIIIDYNNGNLQSNIYQNGYIENFNFHNLPENITHFQVKGIYLFGADDNGKVLITSNYHINATPNNVDLSHFGKLNIRLGKIPILKTVNMETDIYKLSQIEISDMQKYQANVSQITKIILDISFYENDIETKSFQLKTNVLQDIKFRNIVKITSGLIEKDNPLLFSKITDFFGSGTYVRDDTTFTIHDGFCERNFNHEQFVLIVEKEPNILTDTDEYGLYTRISGRRSGLIECVENKVGNQKTATHWKFIYYNGFIQTYLSYDNMNEWIATGGGQNIEQTNVQGFYVSSKTPLILKNYKTYSSPYTKFLNIPQGYYLKIYDKDNNLKKTKCSLNGSVDIYMASPIEKGYFTISNEKETVIYTSEILDIDLGDVFDDLQYELEVWYGRNIIERYSTTHIDRYKEIITIKNISNKTYNNIYINVLKNEDNIDNIELSLNDNIYLSKITIPTLEANQIVNIYIQITSNKTANNYGKKHFSIEFT